MQHQSPDLSAQDVNLLHLIIIRAQNHPDFPHHPNRVLFDAYDAVFTENGLDTHHDRACLRLLLQLGGPGIPGASLYEKFEHLLQQAGILLDFEDDGDSVAQALHAPALDQPELEQPRGVANLYTSPRKVERRNSFTSIYDLTTAIDRQARARNTTPASEPRAHYDVQPQRARIDGHKHQSRAQRAEKDLESDLSDAITGTSAEEVANPEGDKSHVRRQLRPAQLGSTVYDSDDEVHTRIRDVPVMEVAAQKDKITLLRQAFAAWRTALEPRNQERRLQEWDLAREAEFVVHYSRAVAAYDLYLVDKVFYHWNERYREGEARTAAAKKWFLRFKYFMAWQRFSATQELKAERFTRKTFFGKWQDKFRDRQSELKRSEERVQQMQDAHVARKTFGTWLLRTRMTFKADAVHALSVKQRTFSTWNEQLRSNAIRDRIDDRVIAEAIYKWILAQRSSLMLRRSEQQLKTKVLRTLVEGYRRQKYPHLEAESSLSNQRNVRLLKSTIQCWKLQMNVQHERMEMALVLYHPKIELDSLTIWRTRLKNLQRQELRADDARYYFLMTTTLKHWKKAGDENRKKRINEAYKRARRSVKANLLRDVLKQWHGQCRRIDDLQQRCDHKTMQKATALVQTLFVKWQIRASEWQQNTLQAAAHYESSTLKRTISSVIDTSHALYALKTRAEQFHSIRLSEICSSQLRRISMKAFEVKRRQYDADAMRQRHWAKHVRSILRHWALKSKDITIVQQKPSPLSVDQETIDAGYGTGTGTGTAPGSTIENAVNSNALSSMLGATQRAEDWTAFDQDLLLEGSTTPGYLHTPSKRAARVKALANMNAEVGSTTPATPLTRTQQGGGGGWRISKLKPVPVDTARKPLLFRDLV